MPGADDQRVALFVDEEIENAADEVRANPRVRHVADESRLARIAMHDLGPLMPGRRALVLEEVIQELPGALRLPQSDERPDDTQLVRGVGPGLEGVLPVLPNVRNSAS